MAASPPPSGRNGPVGELADLPGTLARLPDFSAVAAALVRGESAAVGGAWGSSAALVAATLSMGEADGGTGRPLLAVLPRIAEVDDFAADCAAFLGTEPTPGEPGPVAVFPAWETLPEEHDAADPIFGRRLRVLADSEADDESRSPRVLVTSIQALMQPVPGRAARDAATRTLAVGDEVDPEELMRWLSDRGLERVPRLELPGEFSLHGGILDLWPGGEPDPLRVEFFGDEIESLRRFDPETQRKVAGLDAARLLCVAPAGGGGGDGGSKIDDRRRKRSSVPDSPSSKAASLFDSLPAPTAVALLDVAELTDEGQHYLNRLDDPRGLFSVQSVLKKAVRRPSVTVASLAADSFETTAHLRIESVERFTGPKSQVLEELRGVLGVGERALIACHNAGERRRLTEMLDEVGRRKGEGGREDDDRSEQPPSASRLPPSAILLTLGRLTRGFRLVDAGLLVLSDHELFGRHEVRRATKERGAEARAIDNFLDLSDGDLVVHLTQGIGRFRGLKLIDQEAAGTGGRPGEAGGRQKEEHLELEFAGGVRVYVPVSLIHLVQKYVGATKAAPPLSKLGTAGWSNRKAKAAEAVKDMAADMLRLQAAREGGTGLACPPDGELVREFDAAFPYSETPDQADAIAAAKADLERPRPMDRLICGDVGYGKTEVAMRAAFKAVDAGRQVAVLVPTTVLAEQHARSFAERMAEFPVTVESLSRFRTKRETKRILKGLREGTVDVVIGTHRLVSPDVTFRDLGLLVIDEEQRFGVDVKEALKRLRLDVDVMTLSATPIPRTLHMSLLGLRDISNLTTAPQDRQPIETRITRWDDGLIRHAIHRELNRGGQIYFVHNRVRDIKLLKERLQRIVPEATIGIVHGQMGAEELETTMTAFVRGELDVLMATTIIESGLDIPNANTIFIHEAGRYGLADLHQLRGRVGRYKNRAYCYLILKEGRQLTDVAAKRIKAIEEFSELGAGFKIAMRDLEIRGAGNILGTEQSGQINAVGYELYCQLLENAVHTLKGEPIRRPLAVNVDLPVSGYLPNSYVPDGRPKLEIYRKLSNVRSFEELEQFREELRDRFGPIPAPANRALGVKHLQLLGREWGVTEIRIEDGYARLRYEDGERIAVLKAKLKKNLRVADRTSAYIPLPDPDATDEALLEDLSRILGL